MKNRTGIDWSKHEVIVTDSPGLLIHHIKRIDGSSCHNVKFINAGGVLSVTGDFGNWIFCREFHPSAEGEVSGGYWNEKLHIASTQDAYEWDSEKTKAQLQHYFSEYLMDNGKSEDDEDDSTIDYYKTCIDLCDDNEFIYKNYAYTEYPRTWDTESVIFVRTTKLWLKYVYDAFDEICRRIKEEEAAIKLTEEKINNGEI